MKCKLNDLLRQGEIAIVSRKTGIHRNSITRYKQNERLPRIDDAYKIAAYFGKTVYDIWPPD